MKFQVPYRRKSFFNCWVTTSIYRGKKYIYNFCVNFSSAADVKILLGPAFKQNKQSSGRRSKDRRSTNDGDFFQVLISNMKFQSWESSSLIFRFGLVNSPLHVLLKTSEFITRINKSGSFHLSSNLVWITTLKNIIEELKTYVQTSQLIDLRHAFISSRKSVFLGTFRKSADLAFMQFVKYTWLNNNTQTSSYTKKKLYKYLPVWENMAVSCTYYV